MVYRTNVPCPLLDGDDGSGGGGGRVVKQCFYLISMAQRDQWVH